MNNPEIIKQLKFALTLAKQHLDWTGYGDKYERECAREAGLEAVIDKALALEPKKD